MTCAEFQAGLQLAIETRDAAALARLAEHGEQCRQAECRRAWEDEQLLRRAIALWRAVPKPVGGGLVDAVLREVLPPPAPSPAIAARPQHSWQAGSILGAAVALLLAVLVLAPDAGRTVRLAGRTGGTAEAPAAHSEANGSPAGIVDAAPQQTSAAVDAAGISGAYVGLAQDATSFVTDLAMLVVPVAVDDPDEEAATPSHWFQRLGEHIEPVQDGVKNKLGEWFGPPAT